MRRDALIYQPLSRMTEFRHFAVGFRRWRLSRCKLRHFPGRTPAHASTTGAFGGRLRNRITCS
jgi:hypothetical protein